MSIASFLNIALPNTVSAEITADTTDAIIMATAPVWFAIIVTAGFGIRLSAEKKIRKAEEEKAIAYQQQIDELNEKIDYLYEKLEIEENE